MVSHSPRVPVRQVKTRPLDTTTISTMLFAKLILFLKCLKNDNISLKDQESVCYRLKLK